MSANCRLLGVLALSAALWGCASQAPLKVPPSLGDQTAQVALTGRLSVIVSGDSADASNPSPSQSISAAFELMGSPENGGLDLISPLGSVMAQARWTRGQARLVSSKGESVYPSIEALTRDMLGESLPVEALFDWLRGQPWPQARSAANAFPAPTGFTQLGWRIDLSRFSQSIIVAERERLPKVTLRARLDMP